MKSQSIMFSFLIHQEFWAPQNHTWIQAQTANSIRYGFKKPYSWVIKHSFETVVFQLSWTFCGSPTNLLSLKRKPRLTMWLTNTQSMIGGQWSFPRTRILKVMDGPHPKWILSRLESSEQLTPLLGVRKIYQESKSKNSRMQWDLWKTKKGIVVVLDSLTNKVWIIM